MLSNAYLGCYWLSLEIRPVGTRGEFLILLSYLTQLQHLCVIDPQHHAHYRQLKDHEGNAKKLSTLGYNLSLTLGYLLTLQRLCLGAVAYTKGKKGSAEKMEAREERTRNANATIAFRAPASSLPLPRRAVLSFQTRWQRERHRGILWPAGASGCQH